MGETSKNTGICCDAFKAYAASFDWMVMGKGSQKSYVMPHIIADKIKWRINHCPTCGMNVRSIMLTPEQFFSLGGDK